MFCSVKFSGLYGPGTAALLSYGKLPGEMVHDGLAAYAQAEINAAALLWYTTTGWNDCIC